MQRVKKNDQSSEKNGSTRYRRVFEMFREINVAGFVLKNGWVFCQITFLIYMIILAVMDIKEDKCILDFVIRNYMGNLSVICERTVSTRRDYR